MAEIVGLHGFAEKIVHGVHVFHFDMEIRGDAVGQQRPEAGTA